MNENFFVVAIFERKKIEHNFSAFRKLNNGFYNIGAEQGVSDNGSAILLPIGAFCLAGLAFLGDGVSAIDCVPSGVPTADLMLALLTREA